MRMTTIQNVTFSVSGVSRARSAAGEFTKTVPVSTSRTIENTRMIHFAALPR